MRKITSFLMAVFCLIGSSVLAQDGERLSFGVISDIHFENNVGEGAMVKVPKALKNLTSYAKLDALAVVGDLTNNGSAAEYEMLTSVFQDQANFTNPVGQLFFMLGNHDNFDSNGKSNYQEGLKAFNGGEPYPYHIYQVIKGYPFITLSEFSGDSQDTSNPANGSNAYPIDNQKILAGYMEKAAAECPGKPIFIFTHVPPRWTVYGSWPELESGNTWAMKVLNPILNKYPQAVVFAGHSHYPLGDPRSIHQGTNSESEHENFYTVINTASTTYSEINPGAVSEGIHPQGYEYVTEGLILTELDNGDIEIRRYDTYRNLEIGAEQRWVLKAPFDGSQFQYADIRDKDDNPNGRTLRNGLPAPVWADGASLSVEVGGYRGVLTFPQATDDECVFRYRVRLAKDGMVILERFVFSQFYLNTDMPKTLNCNLSGLTPDAEYIVEVVAMDSYDNQSAPLKTTFRTPVVSADLKASADGFWTFNDPSDLLKVESGDMSMQPVAALSRGVSLLGSLEEGGYTAATGAEEGDGAIFLPKAAGMRVNRAPGGLVTRDWTVMWYMMLPNASPYNCPFQTSEENSNDGDLFIRGNQIGMSAMGGYFGQINNETWHRIVLTNRGGDGYVFVDGQQTIHFGSEGRWEIDPWGFYIFVDEDGEMSDTYLSEFGFWERGLTTDEIRSLSGLEPLGETQEKVFNVITQSVKVVDQLDFSITVNANVPVTFELPDWIEPIDVAPFMGQHSYLFRAKAMDSSGSREDVIIVKADGMDDQEVKVEQIYVDPGEVPEPLGWWTFDNMNNPMENRGTISTLVPAHKGSDGRPEVTSDLASAEIKYVAGPTGDNLALSVPKDSYLWLTHNTGSESLNTYTILYDVMLNDVNGYKSMLQNDITNSKDAAIFFKNSGLGRGSIGYNGDFMPEIWYRILFVIKEGCANIYINGQKLTESTTPYDYMVMGPGALLFADEDGEEGLVNVASVRFWDMALSEDMITRLGDSYSDVEELMVVKTSNVRIIDKTDFAITVNANVPFTFDLPDWIEPLDVECVEGEKDYLFRAQPLAEEGRRTGIITIESESFDPVEVPVTQIRLGAQMPEPYATWTFDNAADLMAGDGPATLQIAFKGENGPEVMTSNFGLSEIVAVDGPADGNGAIGVPNDWYLWLTNNMGVSELKDYALLMDIRPRSLNELSAIYQKNADNTTDAGLFVNKGMIGLNASGLGYRGAMTYMKWHRILFVVRNGYASTYIDGFKVGESTSPNAAWSMLPDVLLFADNDGQESYIDIAELRLWDVPITDDNVRELGVIEQGWEDEPFIEVTSRWTFDNPDDLMAGTGSATLRPSIHTGGAPHAVETPADAGIVAIAGPSDDNGAITVPLGSSLQLAHNEEDGTLNNFTLLMDVRFNVLRGYNVFFQADMNNSSDAGLFADGTEIGRNINGLGYGGRLNEGQWHRVIARVEYNLLSCYIDGVKVIQATSSNSGAWVMHELFYFFCDNDGEEKDVDVAEICFWDDFIPVEQIISLGGVGTPTGIDKVQGVQKSQMVQEGIYNLKGQRLSSPQRGLNIINGKLILVK